jgi:hypothetical protein
VHPYSVTPTRLGQILVKAAVIILIVNLTGGGTMSLHNISKKLGIGVIRAYGIVVFPPPDGDYQQP